MREQLILATLQQLHAIHPHGMRAADLATGVHLMGHPRETAESMTSLLHDLKEGGLVQTTAEGLDASVTRWMRTEKGRVQLVQHGHA